MRGGGEDADGGAGRPRGPPGDAAAARGAAGADGTGRSVDEHGPPLAQQRGFADVAVAQFERGERRGQLRVGRLGGTVLVQEGPDLVRYVV